VLLAIIGKDDNALWLKSIQCTQKLSRGEESPKTCQIFEYHKFQVTALSNSASTTDLDINISSLPQFATTNSNSSMPKENNKNHEYGMHSDVVAVIILMALYTLQGVPMGLCGSIHCC
jgi:hypothetical protein